MWIARLAVLPAMLGLVSCSIADEPSRLHTTHAAPIPSGTVSVLDRRPLLPTYPCSRCHEAALPDPRERKLTEFHTQKVLDHGTQGAGAIAATRPTTSTTSSGRRHPRRLQRGLSALRLVPRRQAPRLEGRHPRADDRLLAGRSPAPLVSRPVTIRTAPSSLDDARSTRLPCRGQHPSKAEPGAEVTSDGKEHGTARRPRPR